MSALVPLTFVAVGVLVLALAAYLLTIVWLLRHIRQTAGLIVFGVRAIADQVTPVERIVGEINGDLTAVRDALQGLVVKAGAEPEPHKDEVDIVEPRVDQGEEAGRIRDAVRTVANKAREIATGGAGDA